MRDIIDITWRTKKKRTTRHQIHLSTHTKSIHANRTAINNILDGKQSTIPMARQTKPHRKIHPQTMRRMQHIQDKWTQTWRQVKEELTMPQTETTKNKATKQTQTTPLIYKIPSKENENKK